MSRVCWCYTAFYEIEKPVVPDKFCKYRIEGEEICPETNRRHIQGFVMFNKETPFGALKAMHSTAEFRACKGTPYQNFVYCSKDGKFQEFGIRPRKPKDKKKCTAFQEAYEASTVNEGLAIIKEKRPRDLALHGESIERNLKRAKAQPYEAKFTEFTHEKIPTNKAILLYGGTCLGKTHFACSHFKRPLVVSHIDKLKTLSPDNDGIVFDDMAFAHWPVEAVIHLLDEEFDREINVRYGTINIPAHTPKIFTHNKYNPFYNEDIDDLQKDAIERRLNRVHVHNKLF